MSQLRKISGYVSLLISGLLFNACDSTGSSEEPPEIVMGDPATIVTETDSHYLQDFVVDLNLADKRPVTIAEEKPEEPAQETATQEQPEQPAETTIPSGKPTKASLMARKGLKAPFPQVQMYIPDIETRTYQKFNFESAYGASYEITDGKLNGNYLVLNTKGEITNVYIRYQTIIVARNELGMLPVESLRAVSDWKKIQGDDGVYKIEGLDGKLERSKASNRAIRNAVVKAARDRNWSSGGRQQWLNSVKNVKSTNQKPLAPELRAVMWKVIGKDENGRPFQRQLRIDVPIPAKLED